MDLAEASVHVYLSRIAVEDVFFLCVQSLNFRLRKLDQSEQFHVLIIVRYE